MPRFSARFSSTRALAFPRALFNEGRNRPTCCSAAAESLAQPTFSVARDHINLTQLRLLYKDAALSCRYVDEDESGRGLAELVPHQPTIALEQASSGPIIV